MDLSEARNLPVATYSPHPLAPGHERVVIHDVLIQGETVLDYLERTGLAARIGRRPVKVTINGCRVPREIWRTCRPRAGTRIHVQAVVQGGGDSSKILRTIAFVALAVYAPGLVGAYGKIAVAGAMIAGAMAINALFPVPMPDLSNAEGLGLNDSPTYSLSGGSNRARPYEPMPVIMGTHRVFPDLGAKPYTEFQGEDQFLFEVFNFGYNDVDLSDFRIGESPIASFTGVELEISGPDGKLNMFPGNVDVSDGADLTTPTGFITRTSSPDATMLAVELTGTLFGINDEGDVVGNSIFLELQYRKVGDVSWITPTFQSDTLPAIDLPNIGNFRLIEEEYNRMFAVPPPAGQFRIIHDRRTPLRRVLQWNVTPGQYEVRMQRHSASDVGSNTRFSEIVWSQLRTYQPNALDYTGQSRNGLKIRATGQLNGVVDQFSALASAKTTVFGDGFSVQLVAASNQYISTPTGWPDFPHGSVTLEAWVDGTGPVFQEQGVGGWSDVQVGIEPADRTVKMAVWGRDTILNCGILPAGMHHVCLVYDDVAHMQYGYVNGVLKASAAITRNSTGADQYLLGASGNALTAGGGSFNGKIGGARIYNRPLTGTEVAEHVNGCYRNETSLVARWELDEGTGNAAADFTGKHPGALTNGATWVAGDANAPRIAATSNPAWWALAAARGKYNNGRRVWGAGLPESRIDLAGFKAFATWCTQQNLTFNAVFDQPKTAHEMIQAIALRGRGTVSWATGKLSPVWDAPSLPTVAVFSMANIEAGSFEIQYATEDLADEVVASFINPDLEWQRDNVRVLAPGVTTPTLTRTIELFGNTSRVEAGEDANLYMAQNVYRSRKYKWRMDFEALPISRGEVGALAHDLASVDASGRLMEGTTTSVMKLDRAVLLNVTGSNITIVQPNGMMSTHAVVAGTALTDSITLVTPLGFNPGADATHPPYDYKYIYGSSSAPGRKVKIEAVRPLSEDKVEIHAFDEVPDYYTSKTNPTFYTPPNSFGAVTIEDLALTEEGVTAGVGYAVRVTASWSALGNYDHADVAVGINGAPKQLVVKGTRNTFAEIFVQDDVDVQVEVTGYSSLGLLGQISKITLTKHINFAALSRPSDVVSLTLHGDQFNWPLVPDVDVIGYHLRFAYGSVPSWESATPLHEGYVTDTPWRPVVLPRGEVSFLIKAIDAAGLDSVNATTITKQLDDDAVTNVLEEFDRAAAGFPGIKTNGTVDGFGHLIADGATLMWNANDSTPMWDAVGSTLMWGAASFEEMIYEDSVTAQGALLPSRMFIEHEALGNPFTVEFRDSGPDPMWSAGTDADFMFPAGTDAESMWGPFPDYQAWLGPIIADATVYDFRLTTGQGSVRGDIGAFSVVFDVEDLVEYIDDFAVAAGGSRLPITRPFRVIKVVDLTLQAGTSALSAKRHDKDVALGPLVQCFDGTNNPVSGVVDAIVQGY